MQCLLYKWLKTPLCAKIPLFIRLVTENNVDSPILLFHSRHGLSLGLCIYPFFQVLSCLIFLIRLRMFYLFMLNTIIPTPSLLLSTYTAHECTYPDLHGP